MLLCENAEGYRNLVKLVSAGFLEGFYYKPRIDYDLLSKHSKGLIALSACLRGDGGRRACSKASTMWRARMRLPIAGYFWQG